MSVTYGFYNSKNKDRRYDAIQMSSIFDGIIRDGILQHVGTAMMVNASTGMMVNVGIGRAWFNHTWTLNDALLPLTVPQSEVILNRIDAMIDKQLLAVHIPRKAANAVVESDDVRIEAVQEVIERIERRNAAARRHVDIGPKGHDTLLRMAFGIGMDRQVALIEMADDVGIVDLFLRNEDGNAGALRIVILAGHV